MDLNDEEETSELFTFFQDNRFNNPLKLKGELVKVKNHLPTNYLCEGLSAFCFVMICY